MPPYETLTEECIADLVNTFYGRVREDRLLWPVFTRAIGPDWGRHLAKMNAFWSSVLLASCVYKGNPMIAHLQLPRLTERHFDRWLELWRETASERCSEDVAAAFVRRAESIGARLLYAVSAYHDAATRMTAQAPQAL